MNWRCWARGRPSWTGVAGAGTGSGVARAEAMAVVVEAEEKEKEAVQWGGWAVVVTAA